MPKRIQLTIVLENIDLSVIKVTQISSLRVFFFLSLFSFFFFFFYKKSIDLSTVICHVVNIGGLRMTNCYKSTVLSNQIDETQDSA